MRRKTYGYPNMKRRDVVGGEFDWFAIDEDGHVGHFSMAGFGPTPKTIFDNPSPDSIADQILVLPWKTITDFIRPESGKIDDWIEMAKRGLYSYDWEHWKGPYRWIATPAMPIVIVDLPPDLQQIIRLLQFKNVCFRDKKEIRPEDYFECESDY